MGRNCISRVILCLGLGALATIVVAEACRRGAPLDPGHQVALGVTEPAGRAWLVRVYRRPGARRLEARAVWDLDLYQGGRYAGRTLDPSLIEGAPLLQARPDASGPFRWTHVTDLRGWPFPALSGTPTPEPGPGPGQARSDGDGPFRAWFWTSRRFAAAIDTGALTRRPRWSGFLLDTLVYAGAWGVLLYGIVPMWRFLGRRRLRPASLAAAGLGLLTTLSTVLSCALFIDVGASPLTAGWVGGGNWIIGGDLDAGRAHVTRHRTLGAVRVRVAAPPAPLVAEDRRGWPFPAMRSRLRGRRIDAATMNVERIEQGIELRPATATGRNAFDAARTLPLGIVWPGFLADTAIFTAAWFGLFSLRASAEALRRLERRRRGRCLECGYDLQGTDRVRCPECGSETSKRRNVKMSK